MQKKIFLFIKEKSVIHLKLKLIYWQKEVLILNYINFYLFIIYECLVNEANNMWFTNHIFNIIIIH